MPAVSADRSRRRPVASGFFEQTLAYYRKLTTEALLAYVPVGGPSYLYDLVPVYPRRPAKGLRAALCFASCAALGGDLHLALNSAVAIELFHNAFLVHDDIQDGSQQRRGAPTLHTAHGVPIALNVGNATNLLGLHRLMENRSLVGPRLSWKVMQETECMMRHSLEGQAMELGWVRDNTCQLGTRDYLQMCLKKTAWYSFIYPMRVGALIARNGDLTVRQFCRFGWYMGAAFQIQDDILNIGGNYHKYGKEICGDLWEGKRTLMLIHVLKHSTAREKRRLREFLAKPRDQHTPAEIAWLHGLMVKRDSISFARNVARQLAGAALLEGLATLRHVQESEHKRFIMEMVLYLVNRDR